MIKAASFGITGLLPVAVLEGILTDALLFTRALRARFIRLAKDSVMHTLDRSSVSDQRTCGVISSAQRTEMYGFVDTPRSGAGHRMKVGIAGLDPAPNVRVRSP